MMVEASLTSCSVSDAGAGDVDQDAARAVDGAVLEQRARRWRACAASTARFSPLATAVPITA